VSNPTTFYYNDFKCPFCGHLSTTPIRGACPVCDTYIPVGGTDVPNRPTRPSRATREGVKKRGAESI